MFFKIIKEFYNETEIYNNHKPMPANTWSLLWSKSFLCEILLYVKYLNKIILIIGLTNGLNPIGINWFLLI